MIIVGVIIIALILVVSVAVVLNTGNGDGSNNGELVRDGNEVNLTRIQSKCI